MVPLELYTKARFNLNANTANIASLRVLIVFIAFQIPDPLEHGQSKNRCEPNKKRKTEIRFNLQICKIHSSLY